jgi:hypothetical protein
VIEALELITGVLEGQAIEKSGKSESGREKKGGREKESAMYKPVQFLRNIHEKTMKHT